MRRRLSLNNYPVLSILFLFLFLTGTSGASQELKDPTKVNWQQSMSVEVSLGVRLKEGDGHFEALFVVYAPDGRKHELRRDGEEGPFIYVSFPGDFGVSRIPGEYSWKCIVGNQPVAGGKFKFSTVKTYSDQATILR